MKTGKSVATLKISMQFSLKESSRKRNKPQKKIYSEAKIQFLPITAPTFESNVIEKGVAGHSPRYSRGKTLFEVEVETPFQEIFTANITED